jgi:hypothetical protein
MIYFEDKYILNFPYKLAYSYPHSYPQIVDNYLPHSNVGNFGGKIPLNLPQIYGEKL